MKVTKVTYRRKKKQTTLKTKTTYRRKKKQTNLKTEATFWEKDEANKSEDSKLYALESSWSIKSLNTWNWKLPKCR